jgi:hypothetical protein
MRQKWRSTDTGKKILMDSASLIGGKPHRATIIASGKGETMKRAISSR